MVIITPKLHYLTATSILLTKITVKITVKYSMCYKKNFQHGSVFFVFFVGLTQQYYLNPDVQAKKKRGGGCTFTRDECAKPADDILFLFLLCALVK